MESDDEFHSFSIRPVSDARFHAAALCPACRQILPLDRFKRTLSGGEAIAAGYRKGAKVVVDTEKCRDCNPKTKRTPLSKLTRDQIKSRVATGEMPEYVGRKLIEARDHKMSLPVRSAEGRAYQQRRWRNVYSKEWGEYVKQIGEEIRTVTYQLRYAVHSKPGTEYHDFLEFYMQELQALRGILRMERRKAGARPDKTSWHGFMSDTTRRNLKAMWNRVPTEQRVRARVPDIVAPANSKQAAEDGTPMGPKAPGISGLKTLTPRSKRKAENQQPPVSAPTKPRASDKPDAEWDAFLRDHT